MGTRSSQFSGVRIKQVKNYVYNNQLLGNTVRDKFRRVVVSYLKRSDLIGFLGFHCFERVQKRFLKGFNGF